MALLSKQIFVNLPVKDLEASKTFFGSIGFEFNLNFTDDKAACMIVGENIFVMLLQEDFFKGFTNKDIANAAATTEVLVGISADSKEEVLALVDRAFAAGAKPSIDPVDHGFMYQAGFQDLDGHMWEVMYMDPSALEQPSE
ncbi:glyoxalase/bleomycin resistance/extradiol dioxygenase family protein [Paenibacillus sp. 1011MAR3C5]|uniref:VOC family protein n=1 Tax=Paenibacillus sp. 1011MAR3C5 TaxID=1675787 RepID=UPI000E6D02F9|nr:VOC family protein [Paenibacillus sp. 1011MAR3C5]RJE89732.1 glyoxalase/bleomycin resistance/extradiol dioxygenase family protein [Paenibacillus sp. 1011MAR3C5]